jgi:hypothetical protein
MAENVLQDKGMAKSDDRELVAAMATTPIIAAARTIQAFTRESTPGSSLFPLIEALKKKTDAAIAGDVKQIETALLAQAMALDAIFNELASRAASAMGKQPAVLEQCLRLALKAQAQSRATLEAAIIARAARLDAVRQDQALVQGQGPRRSPWTISDPLNAGRPERSPNELLDS